jgi:predicted RNase H-like HicB family nuclease
MDASTLRIDIFYDKEAQVFIATSADLAGLVVEAPTLDELVKEADGAIEMLLDDAPAHAPYTGASYRFERELRTA